MDDFTSELDGYLLESRIKVNVIVANHKELSMQWNVTKNDNFISIESLL